MEYCIIYLSTATPEFNPDMLGRIAQTASVNNKPLNITGMLLYSGTHFLQVLEGDQKLIEMLLKHIDQDSRHTDIELIMNTAIQKRVFADWHMGVLDVSRHRDLDREKFKFITDQAVCDPAAAGRAAISVLKLFRSELPDPLARYKKKTA